MVRFFALVLLLCFGTAQAQEDEKYVLNLQIENDLTADTDQNYTNGVRASLSFKPGKEPGILKDLLYWFPLLPKEGKRRGSIAIGQSMFTPEDIERSDLIVDDRPYVGWLYAGFGVASVRESEYNEVGATYQRGIQDSLELDLGIIGPGSIASKTQRWWHSVIGSPRPNGWANQIRNEPGVALYYQRTWRYQWKDSLAGLDFEIAPHAGGALGNVSTFGAVGGTIRIGSELGLDFGAPPRITPSLPGSDLFSRADGFEWYVFGGVEGRGVLQNITLDGNTFRHSHSVAKEYFVREAQLGFAILYNGVRLAYTQVIRSDEFKLQTGGNGFGALTLSFHF